MIYFCYERNQVDRHWQPVVYYDDVPALNSAGKESAPARSTVWEVPEDCVDIFDTPKGRHMIYEPHFGKLQKRFPKP